MANAIPRRSARRWWSRKSRPASGAQQRTRRRHSLVRREGWGGARAKHWRIVNLPFPSHDNCTANGPVSEGSALDCVDRFSELDAIESTSMAAATGILASLSVASGRGHAIRCREPPTTPHYPLPRACPGRKRRRSLRLLEEAGLEDEGPLPVPDFDLFVAGGQPDVLVDGAAQTGCAAALRFGVHAHHTPHARSSSVDRGGPLDGA